MLLPYAMENSNIIGLIKLALIKIKQGKIIVPGITTIEKAVNEAIIAADNEVIEILNKNLTKQQKDKLDSLISLQNKDSKTKLGWLKEDVGNSSPKTFIEVVKRLEFIGELQLNPNIKLLHENKIRQLYRLGSKYEAYSIRRFEAKKRYSILVLYLHELSKNLVNKSIEIHERQINILL